MISERRVKLAIAGTYIQGVFIRMVTEVRETLCGLEATSAEVSRCAGLLDEQLEKLHMRSLGPVPSWCCMSAMKTCAEGEPCACRHAEIHI